MRQQPVLTRRRLLQGLAALGGGALVAYYVERQPTTDAPADAATPGTPPPATPASQAREAPALTQRVQQGDLPPLAARLPAQPLVLSSIDQSGAYGGEVHEPLLSGDRTALERLLGNELLVRWRPDTRGFTADETVPNVAERITASADGAIYTIVLRAGIRWSDGEPLTTEDVRFWYEDVLGNADLRLAAPLDWLWPGGQAARVEVVDAQTLVLHFATPNGLFIPWLATPAGRDFVTHPAHYLKQFHQRYNPQVQDLVAQHHAGNWAQLFRQQADTWYNPDKPTLNAWLLATPLNTTGLSITAERNPYYWKVDPSGKQLPYLDRIVFSLLTPSGLLTNVLAGNFDFEERYTTSQQNKPLFVDNEHKGQFHLFDTLVSRHNTLMLVLNLTHPNAAKRQLFQSLDFRGGLSYAINRQQIIDTVFVGQGEPWQGAPRPESPCYHERLAKQYTEYDVTRANAALDKIAPQRDAADRRLGPDGQPIQIQIVYGGGQTFTDCLQLIKRDAEAVGITIDIRPVTGGNATQIVAHNEHDATVAIGEHGLEVLLAPEWYLPTNGMTAPYAPPWARWFQSPDAPGASEPPAIAQRQVALYRQLQATPNVAQQHALMRQILDLAADAFYAIGISLHPPGYGMVKNTLHNVPAAMLSSPLFEEPAPLNTCLFYRDAEARSGETAAVLRSGKTSGSDVAPAPRPGSSQARA